MKTGFDLNVFSARLVQLREKREYSQFELSAESEVELGVIEDLEEARQAPTLEQIRGLSATLATSQEYLLGLTESDEPLVVVQGMSGTVNGEQGEILEMVLNNETGWHARGYIAPTELEKSMLRHGMSFHQGSPRELTQFYWDVLPFVLSRVRSLNLLANVSIGE